MSQETSIKKGQRPSAFPENQQYVADVLSDLEKGMSEYTDREMFMAGSEVRKPRAPRTTTSSGEKRGMWKESVFVLDDDYVPDYMNEQHLTVAEIKQDLKKRFDLDFEGIPYSHGAADFSSLSVASISAKDIVMRATGMTSAKYDQMGPHERTSLFSTVFDKSRREKNFALADQIAAERQLPIPGFPPPYTAKDLAEWRSDPAHRFTWDEQISGGYNLVPTIIHGNVPHTGLVSSSTNAEEYFQKRASDPPEKYSWSEENAPITIEELSFMERPLTAERQADAVSPDRSSGKSPSEGISLKESEEEPVKQNSQVMGGLDVDSVPEQSEQNDISMDQLAVETAPVQSEQNDLSMDQSAIEAAPVQSEQNDISMDQLAVEAAPVQSEQNDISMDQLKIDPAPDQSEQDVISLDQLQVDPAPDNDNQLRNDAAEEQAEANAY